MTYGTAHEKHARAVLWTLRGTAAVVQNLKGQTCIYESPCKKRGDSGPRALRETQGGMCGCCHPQTLPRHVHSTYFCPLSETWLNESNERTYGYLGTVQRPAPIMSACLTARQV